MNSHPHTQDKQSYTTPYVVLLTQGLVRYATATPEFGQWFSSLLVEHMERLNSLSSGVSIPMDMETVAALPRSDAVAARRAVWLLDAITERRIPGYRDASAVLQTWHMSREHDEPKAVVLGIKYGVLNFGIIGHPMKRREPMDVLIRDDVLEHSQGLQLATLVHELTHRVVEQGLIQAGGSTSQLEPELGDWLFGDKALAIYRTRKDVLQTVLEKLEHMGAPCAHQTDEEGITALAFSPALDITDISGDEDLQHVEVS